MNALDPDQPTFDYDEFAMFDENIAEAGLAVVAPPVERVEATLPDGRTISALRWGEEEPELVFVHGSAQNAHTWDTVALALGRPAVAVDLPGHGRSSWRDDHAYDPWTLADDLAVAIQTLAPLARVVVGMSLGGLTSAVAAHRRPDVVRSLVLVDITPGVTEDKAAAIRAFVEGPQSFPSFGELLDRTVEHHPTRAVTSLRRGILHNAARQEDGSWIWRYDRSRPSGVEAEVPDRSRLWDVIGAAAQPLTFVRGGDSPVVDDDDVAELRRRRPDVTVHVVDGAGHSVQGDRPVELAAIVGDVLG